MITGTITINLHVWFDQLSHVQEAQPSHLGQSSVPSRWAMVNNRTLQTLTVFVTELLDLNLCHNWSLLGVEKYWLAFVRMQRFGVIGALCCDRGREGRGAVGGGSGTRPHRSQTQTGHCKYQSSPHHQRTPTTSVPPPSLAGCPVYKSSPHHQRTPTTSVPPPSLLLGVQCTSQDICLSKQGKRHIIYHCHPLQMQWWTDMHTFPWSARLRHLYLTWCSQSIIDDGTAHRW